MKEPFFEMDNFSLRFNVLSVPIFKQHNYETNITNL